MIPAIVDRTAGHSALVSDQCLVKPKVSCYTKWKRTKKPIGKEN